MNRSECRTLFFGSVGFDAGLVEPLLEKLVVPWTLIIPHCPPRPVSDLISKPHQVNSWEFRI